MKKIFLLLLPLILLGGCHKIPEKKSSFRLNMVDDPVSLDPRSVRSLKDLTIVKQLFEGLMRTDEAGTPQPAIAKRVEISDDLLTYTFFLREAYWTNGDLVTAGDFKAAWSKVLDPDFACDYSHMLYPLKNSREIREGNCSSEDLGVVVVDDQTLVVELVSPTPYFLELVAFPTYFPVHASLDQTCSNWSAPPAKQFVSNGPFKLCKWDVGSQMDFEKNPTYWDADKVELETIAFSVIGDNNTESQLFDKDELDWLGQPISANIATELIGRFNAENKLLSYPIAGTHWIKLNTDRPPFDNVKIRKAFACAVDRQEIITHILQGKQSVATRLVPISMGLHEQPYFADGDRAKAKELFEEGLTEQGWDRNSFPAVVINYPPQERDGKIVQLVQQQWQQTFDIPIRLEIMENQLYRRNVREGHYQAGIGGWVGDFHDPISFLELFQYRNDSPLGSGMNGTRWQDDRYASLIDLSMGESNPEKRWAILQAVEEILMTEMPVIPLYHYSFDYVKKDWIDGVILSPLGIADFKKTSVHR